MPTYIDIDYITERVDDDNLYILTGEAGDSSYDSTLINNMIDDAEGIVNSHISKRYTVPLTGDDITTLAQRLTFDIAMYHISGNRAIDRPYEDYYERYKSALSTLKAIRDGKQDLVGATAIQGNSSLETIYSTSSTDARHFTASNFDSKKPSDEWL